MEEIDGLLRKDAEANFLSSESRKVNRKRKRRRVRFIVLLIVFAIGLMYFISDFSKVKSLDVEGNAYYTKEDILDKTGLTYNTRYILVPGFYIEWNLEKDALIEKVRLNKEMDGRITLQIQEKLIIGYFVADEKNYVLTSDGERYELDGAHLNTIVNVPLVDGFSEEEMIKMAKAFDKSERVDVQVIQMISEIHPYATSYDPNMVKIVMQDGNKIYTSYDSLFLLNTYKKTLKELKSTHVCMFMDANTNAIVTQNCEEFEKSKSEDVPKAGEDVSKEAPEEQQVEEKTDENKEN